MHRHRRNRRKPHPFQPQRWLPQQRIRQVEWTEPLLAGQPAVVVVAAVEMIYIDWKLLSLPWRGSSRRLQRLRRQQRQLVELPVVVVAVAVVGVRGPYLYETC